MNKTIKRFIIQLEKIGDDFDSQAELSSSNKLTQKDQRGMDAPYRETLARVAAVLDKVIDTSDEAKAIQAHRDKNPEIKSNDPYLVILRSYIDYGEDGAQYASRDKKVLQGAERERVKPEELPEFILKCGGLVKCAARARQQLTQPDGVTVDTSALTEENDLMLVVLRREAKGPVKFREFLLENLSKSRDRRDFLATLTGHLEEMGMLRSCQEVGSAAEQEGE